jgi:hypothetical protein
MTRLPVLVVPEMGGGFLTLVNVGKGPALNIVLGVGEPALAQNDAREISLDQLSTALIPKLTHLSPLASGSTRREKWSGSHVSVISYTDALGVSYTTFASTNGTKILRGNAFPGVSMADLPPVGIEGPRPR